MLGAGGLSASYSDQSVLSSEAKSQLELAQRAGYGGTGFFAPLVNVATGRSALTASPSTSSFPQYAIWIAAALGGLWLVMRYRKGAT